MRAKYKIVDESTPQFKFFSVYQKGFFGWNYDTFFRSLKEAENYLKTPEYPVYIYNNNGERMNGD